MSKWLPWVLGLVFAGCAESPSASVAPDAEPVDAAPPDAEADAISPDAALPEPVRLQLNEVDCRDADRVELVNLGGPGELAGHTLEDEQGGVYRLRGAVGDRLTVSPGFALYCGVSALVLRDPAGVELDRVTPPVDAAAVTWGRLPDGTGPWQPTAPTPDAPNAAPAVAGLFDGQLHSVALTVGEPEVVVLGRDPSRVQVASVRVDGGEALPVGVNVFGRDGRWRRFDQKPNLGLRFDHLDATARAFGLAGLELHNGVLDPSGLRRWVGAELVRQAGLPAPRVGFAEVTVNGAPYGLYRLVEPRDATYFDRHHVSTWAAYTADNREITPNDVARMRVLVGEPGTRPVLSALADRLAEAEGAYADSAHRVDWPQVLKALAVEAWLGHGDGYGAQRRHLTLHFDALDQARLHVGALDRVLRRDDSVYRARGVLLRRCLADLDCMAAYDAALAEVGRALASPNLASLQAVAARIRPALVADARHPWTPEMFDAEVAELAERVQARAAEMAAQAECLDTAEDADGDGYRCAADCAPDDPTQHLGALDVCGDNIDQDCNGVVDDGPECPPCVAEARGEHRYLFCPEGAAWANAQRTCEAFGMNLIRVDSAGENTWASQRARRINVSNWWIGINDRADEGVYVWADGSSSEGFTAWGGGEPNDWGSGEDCGHFRTDGLWNDIPCNRAFPFVCEAPCDPATDADGDGWPGCGVDCDDDDPAVNPAAAEICGDGVDQDCSGRADDGPACGACADAEGPDGQTYTFCPEGRTHAEAAAACAERGARLPVIDDAALNAWVWRTAVSVSGQRWWLGLTDAETELSWRWPDGAAPTWVNWSRGQPDDGSRREDCAHLWEDGDQWNDAPCDARYGVICQSAE